MKRDMDLVRDLLLWIENIDIEANAKAIFSTDLDQAVYNLKIIYGMGHAVNGRAPTYGP